MGYDQLLFDNLILLSSFESSYLEQKILPAKELFLTGQQKANVNMRGTPFMGCASFSFYCGKSSEYT